MLRKKKHADKVTNFEIRPPSPTIEQMIEDVEESDPSDFIFTTGQDPDTAEHLVDVSDDDEEEEFYETRTSFDTNPSILYETIDEQFETMCKIIKLNDQLMIHREDVQDTLDELAAKVDAVKSLKDKLKTDISGVVSDHTTNSDTTLEVNESPNDDKELQDDPA